MYKAIDVADYIVNECIEDERPISNLKLQKLLYYIQAAKLVETDGTEMFYDKISAWKYGPVVEKVYYRFKSNVDRPITKKVTNSRGFMFYFGKEEDYHPEKIICDKDKTIIKHVIDSYREYSPLDMVRKTHNEEPWIEAFSQQQTYISSESIQNFYSKNKKLIYGES